MRNNPANRNVPRQAVVAYQSGTARQLASHQPYQSNHPSRGYHRSDEKGVYLVNDEEADPYLEGFYKTLEQKGNEV